jgi:hypothetical protein
MQLYGKPIGEQAREWQEIVEKCSTNYDFSYLTEASARTVATFNESLNPEHGEAQLEEGLPEAQADAVELLNGVPNPEHGEAQLEEGLPEAPPGEAIDLPDMLHQAHPAPHQGLAFMEYFCSPTNALVVSALLLLLFLLHHSYA